MTDTRTLLAERGRTHGSFTLNAGYAQVLRTMFRQSQGWQACSDVERESLDHIAGKLARIMSTPKGRQVHDDHWRDIAGYAELAVRDRERDGG